MDEPIPDDMFDQELDETAVKILVKCDEIKQMLLDKNARYGNSSLAPANYFKDLPRDAKIEARIEDKMARITRIDKHKHHESYKDAIRDLIGYLVIYLICLEEDEER